MIPVNPVNCEIWSEIKGYEGLYYISSRGRVKKLVKDKEGNVKDKMMALAPSGATREYRAVSLTKDSVTKAYLVHRLVAESFIGLPGRWNPDGSVMRTDPEINHKDGCCSNNDVSNLEWCDRYYNNAHRRPSSEWNYTKRNYETGRKKHEKRNSEKT